MLTTEGRTKAFVLTRMLTLMGGVAAIVGTIVTAAFSYRQCTRDYNNEVNFAPALFKNIIGEQREVISQKAREMKEAGATQEENRVEPNQPAT